MQYVYSEVGCGCLRTKLTFVLQTSKKNNKNNFRLLYDFTIPRQTCK